MTYFLNGCGFEIVEQLHDMIDNLKFFFFGYDMQDNKFDNEDCEFWNYACKTPCTNTIELCV